MFGQSLEAVRKKRPLIHNITNYVTINDCANVLLACGASPIMADDAAEVEEITVGCDGLVLNIGTLNHRRIPAMLKAGKKAKALGHPVVLDPVGAGASAFRTQTAQDIIKTVRPDVIRANSSEIRALAAGTTTTKGVDADTNDEQAAADHIDEVVVFAKHYAAQTGAIIAMTGVADIVADANHAYVIHNGHPMMADVTGTGCQLSAITAAFVAASPDDALMATVAAVCAMGLAGEIAHDRLEAQDGNATYRTYIIDAIYRMTPSQLSEGAKVDIR